MDRPPRKVLIGAGVAGGVLVLGIGGAMYLESAQYVTTDNAQVDGQQIQINSPATGTLTGWQADEGVTVRDNQPVGKVELSGSGAQPKKVVRAPGDGVVALNETVEGQWVTSGQRLATAYDQGGIYATARVDETDVSDVKVGAPVDIEVDAYPDVEVKGVVSEIQDSAAAVFSLFPESNSSGNFQKVTQVIPVKIVFINAAGLELVPGMNVTARIEKQD